MAGGERMKKGTILKNSGVSDSNALKYSIYLGTCGDSVNVLFYHCGHIKKARYCKRDVGEGKPIYPIKESDVLKRIENMIKEEFESAKDGG